MEKFTPEERHGGGESKERGKNSDKYKQTLYEQNDNNYNNY